MQAIIPNRPAHVRPYAWGSVTVNPDPPRVGEVTRIGFPLANPGPEELVVERIAVRVAAFGMGVAWEELDPIGPFHLPPDPQHIEEAVIQWTPAQGGHRCVRADIHVAGMMPMTVGRNLHVLQADAEEAYWRVPFHLGNPEPVRAPIVLRVGGEGDPNLGVALRIAGADVRPDRPFWLKPGQEVEAELRLFAPEGAALHAIRTVEAYVGNRLIDGIQVAVLRPALVQPMPRARNIRETAMTRTRELVRVG
jgi:hypothetical protein